VELTFATQYARVIGDVIADAGGDRAAWLARNKLTDAHLAAAEITLSVRALRTLIETAIEVSGETALGLLVGARLASAAHGLVGFAASSAPTLQSALDTLERFAALRVPVVTFDRVADGASVCVRVRTSAALGDAKDPIRETAVLAIVKVVRELTLGAARIRSVAFELERPAHAALARQLCATEVRYRQSWTGLVLDARDLARPLQLANLELHAEARRLCEATLARRSDRRGTAARLRELMLQQDALPSLPVAARLMGMGPRTLHRRLVAERTSFRSVLEAIRRELAREHLRANQLSIGQIGHLLGYTDISNFRRAFTRWELVAPSRFRKRAR